MNLFLCTRNNNNNKEVDEKKMRFEYIGRECRGFMEELKRIVRI
jgi:hypothetical protein